jgi:hypothetical protein
MKRVTLVLWNRKEAEARAAALRKTGYTVECRWREGGVGWREVRNDPPDFFVIDLNRLPSHGKALGIWLRQQKATRRVPIVFIEGDPAKTGLVKELLPDAVYTPWNRIRGALRRKAPADPKVPGTMAGYSGTPLTKKLGIRAGSAVALLNAPPQFERTLGELPEGASLRRQARGKARVILLFSRSMTDLERRFPAAARATEEAGRLWIVWPKKASGIVSDLNQNAVRAFGLDAGWVDFKICAVDETWSGLCFTRRRT